MLYDLGKSTVCRMPAARQLQHGDFPSQWSFGAVPSMTYERSGPG
jgi:hypothetical protein